MKKMICAVVFALLTGVFASAQTPTPIPTPTPKVETNISTDSDGIKLPTNIGFINLKPLNQASLETILAEADKQVAFYKETFKDLLAIETKTFEEFDKSGDLDERTIVESNFLVYQSSKDAKRSSELRNVVKVNDKLIPDSQARAERFLGELQKAQTAEKELEKIQDEGLRYDKTIKIIGFTLFEAVTLADNLRPFFEYKLEGTENVEGSDAYVVSYRQTKKSPFVVFNDKAPDTKGAFTQYDISLPGALKKNDVFLRGKLWIDAQTFQVRREQRQVTVQTNSAPLVAQETIFEYAPSEFGILVPKRIVFQDNDLKKISKSDDFNTVKDTVVTFDYSKFKKTDVDIKLLDEENP